MTKPDGAGPGPGPLPDAVLRALELNLRRRVSGLLPGEHRSAGTGVGTELALVRPYRPGDDVRRIEWNVTARTGQPHVREDVAERVLTSWILLDVSPSMTFGTADRRKWDVAEGAAIVFAHIGARRGNRVGVVAFGGEGKPTMYPPRQGRAGMLSVLTSLRGEPAAEHGGATVFSEAFRHVARVARKGALVSIISDFRGRLEWTAALSELAARCEVVAVEVRDPREQQLVPVGHLWLVDPETGRQLVVDTNNRKLRERFADAATAERETVAEAIGGAGAAHVVLGTEGDWLRSLAGFLHRSRSRRWRTA